MPEITAVIPNWNGARFLPRAIESLKAQTVPVSILVADNGSTDGSDRSAEQDGARVVRLGVNQGFARAVNLALAEVASPLVAIVNNDVELEPDWAARLAGAVLASPDVWFATGKLLSAREPDRIDATFDLVSRAGCAWRCGSGQADGGPWSQARAITLAPLTAALFRRELFDRIGLLDERFESYLEDVDFGIRCALEGLNGVYVPEAQGTHQGSATLGVWSPRMVYLLARNQVYLVSKHYARNWNAGTLWRVLMGQMLWGLVATRHGAAFAWLRGKWDGLNDRADFGSPHPRIHHVLGESENLLRDLQESTGMDRYWRLYFALA